MSWLRKIWRLYGINPLDTILNRAKKQEKRSFLLCWNRGLGDIPLGIYPLIHKIREVIPDAEITILTREDLKEGFSLLSGVNVVVDPKWARKKPIEIDPLLIDEKGFDVVMRSPDPTAWLMRGKVSPSLAWKQEWDGCFPPLDPSRVYVAVHVETQTEYGYEKNWPIAHWQELFHSLPKEWGILLIGGPSSIHFTGDNVIDLRGKTSLIELLSLIKNRCRYLIAPDSGILSMVYYVNAVYPLRIVSLWADPKQGVLKQGTPSPNPLLEHRALVAQDRDLRKVMPELVWQEVCGC